MPSGKVIAQCLEVHCIGVPFFSCNCPGLARLRQCVFKMNFVYGGGGGGGGGGGQVFTNCMFIHCPMVHVCQPQILIIV